MATYHTDVTHFLTEKGAIGPTSGPGRKLAEFIAAIIVFATHDEADRYVPCKCCGKNITAYVSDENDSIVWMCDDCPEQGVITNWRGTLWDMENGMPSTSDRN